MKPAEMEVWKEQLDKNAHAVCETFKTTNGKKVLTLLQTHFKGQFDENPYKMARNAGQLEIVQYIEALIERGGKI